jgi:hypothetical protein
MGYKDKEVQRQANKEYYETHKTQRLAQRRAWYKKNSAKVCKRQQAYYQENVNHYRDYVTQRNLARRIRVLTHYSGGVPKCACCGETILDFLTIDHINLDGAKHRREISSKSERAAGQKTYVWLEKNGYPEGFQVLCYNCNCGSFKHKGICPHKL